MYTKEYLIEEIRLTKEYLEKLYLCNASKESINAAIHRIESLTEELEKPKYV